MTTELYRIFHQVVESGSISKAAQALFVSQPAVTKSIKSLEESLGITLFHRKAQGVVLTQEGKMLYEHVQLAFRQLTLGERLMRQLKDKEVGTVRIGISNTLCKYYFLPYLKIFHEKNPKIKIEIVNRTSLETIDLLQGNAVDCAIISDMPLPKNYDYHRLRDIQDTFVSKEKPPILPMTLEVLGKYPLLMMEKKNATRRYIEEYFVKHQIPLQVGIEISSMEFLVEFAKIGLGVSAVIKDFVEEELDAQRLFEWQLDPPLAPRSIGLVFNQALSRSIACQTFLDFMMEG